MPTSSLNLQGGRPCARQAPARTNGRLHAGDDDLIAENRRLKERIAALEGEDKAVAENRRLKAQIAVLEGETEVRTLRVF